MGCVYLLHGLRVRSEATLAGIAVDGDEFDVDVRSGPSAPVGLDPPPGRPILEWAEPRRRYVAADDGTGYRLRVPGCIDFVIGRDLRSVECRPDPRLDADLVPLLVAGLVMAFVLRLGGHFILHASAVEFGGTATAFAGRSGAGKSTLAAVLCGAGARLVSDDVLRLQTNGSVSCVAGSSHLRLRPHAAWAYDGPSTTTADGRLAVRLPVAEGPIVPLGTIVLPVVSRAADDVELRPLTGAGAFARLAVLSRVLGWCEPAAQREELGAVARILRDVPVVEATIPWGPDRVHRAVDALLER